MKIKKEQVIKELKIVALFLILCALFFSFKLFDKFLPSVDERTVVVTYFNYIKLWEYERAYGFLSFSQKKQHAVKACFLPESPWGKDWWNIMLDCGNETNRVNDGKQLKSNIEIKLTHVEKGESALGNITLVREENQWKIDSIFIKQINSEPKKVVLTKNEQRKLDSLITSGISKFESSKVWEAYSIFTEAMKINKWNANLNAYLGMCCGKIAGETNDIWEAINYGSNSGLYYETALEIDSANILAHLGRGQGLLFAPPPYGNVVKSVDDFNFVITNDPTNVKAYLFLGLAYKKLNQKDSARIIFENALTIEPANKEIIEEFNKLK